ncbi:unnamed protein product [Prorocentrum cordatum]|uniref:Uncharacterized protein n=1 Tax=Prorocentrum cordatum TaxID=2364126 RepID=A0ABN9XAB4_9DINO|nr:unnamed protein product [Polarella glacialis]
MNFEDCTLVASGNWAAGNRLEQMPRSPTNDCYTHITASLTYTPAQADVERLRLFLCTPCAGQAAGRRVVMAVEALAMHGEPAPPKIIVLQGGGGNSKSATTKLRANVFADSHKFMSASCLQKDDEFRKQGGQFAGASLLTIQECSGGDPLQEEVAKKFASGEVPPCRPNYGETAEYFGWPCAGKFWELSFALPSVVGGPHDPPSLKSWCRRLLVIPLESSYSASPAEVRAGDRVFLDDSTLSPFLDSSVARHIYMLHHLLPFLQKYSADDCRRFISLPGQGTQDRTISFVQQMANGGKKNPWMWIRRPTAAVAAGQVTALGNFCSTYAATQKHRILKPYVFQSLSPTLLPGARGTSVKGKKTKLQNLDDSIHAFPHMFKKPPLAGGDQKLQIDVQKFSDAMSRVENCAVLREIVNLTQLRAYCAKGIDSRQKQLESYIQWHETKGAQEGDFSTIEVKYYRPWGLPGRTYAFGMAAQELTRQARAAAFQGHAVDVDFVAAFSRMGYREARRITHNSTTYGIWRKSILHVGAWRGFIKDYVEISDDAAKSRVGEGRRVIMDSPRFHYLRNQFGDRRAPDATRFACATFALEDEELAKLVEAIKGQDSSTEALVYMFDGAIMSTPAGPAKIQSGIDACEGTSQGISVIVKPFAFFDEKNVLTHEQMEEAGVYFTTANIGFGMDYLRVTKMRLLFGRLRVAVTESALGKTVQFDVEYPAHSVCNDRKVITFQPPTGIKVKALAFDGHFGVFRALEEGVDERTKPLAHVNRKSFKMIEREARVAPCASKHSERARIPNRAGGWQFLLDGGRADVLAAKEHINNECQEDKRQCIQAVCTLQGVRFDLFVYDGMCSFKAWAKKRHKQFYGSSKHWCVDEFHRPNHKCDCPCRRVTPAAKKRLDEVNTSCAEQFNSFIRRFNFFLNSLRPSSHRLWVKETISHWNSREESIRGIAFPRKRRHAAQRVTTKKAVTKKTARATFLSKCRMTKKAVMKTPARQ